MDRDVDAPEIEAVEDWTGHRMPGCLKAYWLSRGAVGGILSPFAIMDLCGDAVRSVPFAKAGDGYLRFHPKGTGCVVLDHEGREVCGIEEFMEGVSYDPRFVESYAARDGLRGKATGAAATLMRLVEAVGIGPIRTARA